MSDLIAQIESLPNLIREQLTPMDARVRKAFNHNEILSTKKILITGCGDSFFAGLAAKMAISKWCGIQVDVASSLAAGRYELPYENQPFPNNPLVLGISVSGKVSRTIEAIKIANQVGARTVAITGNPDSDLAKAAGRVIDCAVPLLPGSPNVRSYQISLLTLYLIAVHFSEVHKRLSIKEATQIRANLLSTADVVEATIAENKEKVEALAGQLRDEKTFHYVSHGPNLATAYFSAAKIVESVGRYAVGQDTEEWAHYEYFNNVKNDVPTFVISPNYRSLDLVKEFTAQMKRIGRRVIAVTPDADQNIGPRADHHLPVVGSVSEELSPLVYMLAGELFAAYLADVTGEAPFRNDDPRYQTDEDHRITQIVSLNKLK